MQAPGYVSLYRSGELARRARALEARLAACDICPRECRVNRLAGERGACRSGPELLVASICDHHGEEPAISGARGSGTVFLGNCNLSCVYCQNSQISQPEQPDAFQVLTPRQLAERLLYLQDRLGCHNINFVTPSHFVPGLVRTLVEAVPLGLRVPIVYNTSSYDSLATLRALEGVVSIYLADLRYASDAAARRYSGVRRYVAHARAAIREMYRQVGNLQTDDSGVAVSGLIVRLLVLPGDLSGTVNSLRWLARKVSPRVTISVMSQYYPAHRAYRYPELARRLTAAEYRRVTSAVTRLGLENGWVQGLASPDTYRPDFRRPAHPFESTPRNR